MTYEQMCRYILEAEGFHDWDQITTVKGSKKNLVGAKYLCMYFGNIFFPAMTLDSLSDVFNMAHGAAAYANKTIVNDCLNDQGLKRKIDNYYNEILHMKSIALGYDALKFNYAENRISDAMKDIISKLQTVANIYCELTGKKIVDV